MTFENFNNLFHIGFCFIVFGLKPCYRVCRFVEKLHDALFFLQSVEAFKLCYQTCQRISNCAQILGSYAFESAVGKVGHLLLSIGSVLQNVGSVGKVDFVYELIYGLLLLRRELDFVFNVNLLERCCFFGFDFFADCKGRDF